MKGEAVKHTCMHAMRTWLCRYDFADIEHHIVTLVQALGSVKRLETILLFWHFINEIELK